MKRWRIPRPKMTTTNNSVRNGQQQERRPADPPRDYLVNDSSSEQETSGGHLSGNEGSPGSSSTNADDWITHLIHSFFLVSFSFSFIYYILFDDPPSLFSPRNMSNTQKGKKKKKLSSRVFIFYWFGFPHPSHTLLNPLRLAFFFKYRIMEQCWLYITNQRSV